MLLLLLLLLNCPVSYEGRRSGGLRMNLFNEHRKHGVHERFRIAPQWECDWRGCKSNPQPRVQYQNAVTTAAGRELTRHSGVVIYGRR